MEKALLITNSNFVITHYKNPNYDFIKIPLLDIEYETFTVNNGGLQLLKVWTNGTMLSKEAVRILDRVNSKRECFYLHIERDDVIYNTIAYIKRFNNEIINFTIEIWSLTTVYINNKKQFEQFYCTCSKAKGLDYDENDMPYCISCQKVVIQK